MTTELILNYSNSNNNFCLLICKILDIRDTLSSDTLSVS